MLSRRAVLKASVGLCGCAACWAAGLSSPAHSDETHIRGPGYDLRFVGTQRDTITNGKLGPVVDLRTLANTPHLYGISPIEQLRGEVTIIDSRPSLLRVGPNTSILVAENFEAAAPYLVWAVVPAWQTVPIPPEVRSFRDLEAFIRHAARSVGLDPQGCRRNYFGFCELRACPLLRPLMRLEAEMLQSGPFDAPTRPSRVARRNLTPGRSQNRA